MYDFTWNPEPDSTNQLYLAQAYVYAKANSSDGNTQNGAVLVHPDAGPLLSSANTWVKNVTIPKEVLDNPRHPDKGLYMVHAETNAILKAAEIGVVTKNTYLYCPWVACPNCAQNIIQTGIKRVVGHKNILDQMSERWKIRVEFGLSLLKEAGVRVVLWEGKVFKEKDNFSILFDGKQFFP